MEENNYNQDNIVIEEKTYKKYTALKVISLIIIVALTALLTYMFIPIATEEDSLGKGIGLALFLTYFVIIIGGIASAVSEIFSIIGLVLSIKKIPKGERKGEVIWFTVLCILPVVILATFYILGLVAV